MEAESRTVLCLTLRIKKRGRLRLAWERREEKVREGRKEEGTLVEDLSIFLRGLTASKYRGNFGPRAWYSSMRCGPQGAIRA